MQWLDEHLILYDLAQIRGTDALLEHIPENYGGVYGFYRRFEYDALVANDPEAFVSYVMTELQKKHSVAREAKLPPAYRVSLTAETIFSKIDDLRTLASDAGFRSIVLMLLDHSMLFQQPLYIGKAGNLHSRVKGHLRQTSSLRHRLKDAGHNIDQCRLLLFLMHQNEQEAMPSSSNDETDMGEDEYSSDSDEPDSDMLVEDILSRLFLPTFTVRYG